MKNTSLLFILFLLTASSCYADNAADVKSVNARVAQIEKTKDKLNTLELILHTGASEATPPEVMYYYKPEDMGLAMIQVSVGHEIFSTRHTYYVDNNHVIKYVKETLNHPDSPPKEAVIYKQDGSILWKNTGEPAVSSKQVLELFRLNMNALREFSKY